MANNELTPARIHEARKAADLSQGQLATLMRFLLLRPLIAAVFLAAFLVSPVLAQRLLYQKTWTLAGHLNSVLSDSWDANLIAKRDKTMLVLKILPSEAEDLVAEARTNYPQQSTIAKFEELQKLTGEVCSWGQNYTGSNEDRKRRFELRSRTKSLLQALERY